MFHEYCGILPQLTSLLSGYPKLSSDVARMLVPLELVSGFLDRALFILSAVAVLIWINDGGSRTGRQNPRRGRIKLYMYGYRTHDDTEDNTDSNIRRRVHHFQSGVSVLQGVGCVCWLKLIWKISFFPTNVYRLARVESPNTNKQNTSYDVWVHGLALGLGAHTVFCG